jgi:hypothetical protein
LPDKYSFPLVALVLGYPNAEPEFKKGRLKGKSIIHWDTYHKSTPSELDELVIEYDDENLHLSLIDNWSKMNMKHYLDWFFSKWSQQVDTQQFVSALKKSGFLPE